MAHNGFTISEGESAINVGSQLEIYHESKHGVLFNDQRSNMNLAVAPDSLSSIRPSA